MALPRFLQRFRLAIILPAHNFSTISVLSNENHLLKSSLKQRLDAWIEVHKQQQSSALSPYVEKISVEYIGHVGESCSLQMTKGISSPFDCAKHLSKLLVNRSVVALVNGKPWDMHRPLVQDCSIDFVHFKDTQHDPSIANVSFWRSASFLLAATLETAFRPEHAVRLLCNWPTEPEDGSVVCDVTFTLTRAGQHDTSNIPWIPSKSELDALSTHGQGLAANAFHFIPLEISTVHPLFCVCLADCPIRRELMSCGSNTSNEETAIASTSSVYRMGDFVDICSSGPLINSTGMVGRFAVTRLYPLGWLRDHTPNEQNPNGVLVYRAHALAIPSAFPTHFTTFERLVWWSHEPNRAVPTQPDYIVLPI